MKKRLFLKNAIILTLTSILLRGIGIFFRIFISNKIGGEGMGLHQLIFSVYTFASALASSGISIATTKLISEKGANRNSADKIMRRSFLISLFFGILAFALLFFFADYISLHYLSDERTALSLKILSTGLPFMALSASLKGYFLARRKASTPSNSQLFEQVVRIGVVALIFSFTDTTNLTYACAAVVCGNAVSELFAFLYIFVGYLLERKTLPLSPHTSSHITRSLLWVLTPLALSSYINTALHTIENIMVPDALTRFTLSREISLSQFGILKGMAIPVLFFPASFLGALSILLITEVSAGKSKSNLSSTKNTVNYTMLITALTSIPAGAIFTFFGSEIGMLVYNSAEAGRYISILGPIVPFMYAESIITGLLNGLNRQTSTLLYNIYNSAIRIVLITLFVPKHGINAFLAIMILSNLFTSCANMRQLFISSNTYPDMRRWIVKPVLSLIPALACSNLSAKFFATPSATSLTAKIIILCAVYCVCIFISGCITKKDLSPLFKLRRQKKLC